VSQNCSALLPGRHFEDVTVWRWVQHYAPVLNQRLRRELRRPNRSWRVDETYVRVAGKWAYLYRAIDSSGDTIDFMLSPKRDLTAAKLFLRLALSGTGGIRPRVINFEQDHRFIKKRMAASLWFRSTEGALRTIDGYEAMHQIRKGQIRWLSQGDGLRQFRNFVTDVEKLDPTP